MLARAWSDRDIRCSPAAGSSAPCPRSILLLLFAIPAAVELPILLGHVLPAAFSPGGSDLLLHELPVRKIVWEGLAAGTLPTWTPLMYGGYPLLASLQAGALAPLSYPPALLPLGPALGLLILLHRWVAIGSTFALARTLGQTAPAAALAGLTFAYSGFFVGHLPHLDVLASTCFAPLVLLGLVQTSRGASPLVACLALAWQFLSGSPQQTVLTILSGLVLSIVTAEGMLSERLRAMGWVLLAAALWPLLILPQLLPTADLVWASDRGASLPPSVILGNPLPPPALLGLFWPSASGSLSSGTFPFDFASGLFAESTAYAGILAPWALLLTLVRPGSRAERALGFLGLFFLLVALGPATPIGKIWASIPVLSAFRNPCRGLFMLNLAMALALGRFASAVASRSRPSLAIMLGLLSLVDLLSFAVRERGDLPARAFLERPAIDAKLTPQNGWRRTYSIDEGYWAGRAYRDTPGFSRDSALHVLAREGLAAQMGIFWDIPCMRGFAGLAPRRSRDVAQTDFLERGATTIPHPVESFLEATGVTHVLSPWPVRGRSLVAAGTQALWGDVAVHVGTLPNAIPGAWCVHRAKAVASGGQALAELAALGFDPRQTVIVEDPDRRLSLPPAEGPADRGNPPSAVLPIPNGLMVSLPPGSRGWLLVTISYDVDLSARDEHGPLEIFRADFGSIAVPLLGSTRVVTIYHRPRMLGTGLVVSGLILVVLLGWRCRRWGIHHHFGTKMPGKPIFVSPCGRVRGR